MDWIPIGEMTAPPLSFMAQKLLHYAQIHKMGLRGREIRVARLALRIGENTMQEALYEIRKRENIIMGKLSNAQKAAIYQAWKDGVPQSDLAKQYGVTTAAICKLVKKLNKAGDSIGIKQAVPAEKVETAALPELLPEKKPASVINPEFDAAVNQMIAEMHDAKAEINAANAEEKSVIAEVSEPVPDPEPDLEDCENGIPNTPLVPDVIPPVIRRLINDGIGYMESKISEYEDQIEEIQAIIDEYRKDIEKAKAWKEQQKWR